MDSERPVVDLSASDPPEGGSPRGGWVLVAAVGLAGALVGYVVGVTAGGGDDNPPGRQITAAAVESTTAPPRDGLGATATTSPSTGSDSTSSYPLLAELVPGWTGDLSVVLLRGPGLELVELSQSGPPRTTPLPVETWHQPDASGRLLAGLTWSASGGEGYTLRVGRGTTMRPAVIDIAAFTWHDTEPGRLAWTETSDNETTLLQTGWVDPAGTFSPGEAIAEVPAGAWLDAWHTWGFLVSGWDPTTETPLVYLLDDDGNELWRFSDVYPYTGFSSSGEILLIRWDTIDPSQRGEPELFVVSPAATARVTLTSLGWDPTGGEGTLGPASLSPDGSRLAFVVWEGELRNGDWGEEGRIEVRLRNGTFVGAFAFSGFARAMEWSGDGRFVLLPVGNTLRVYDTVDDVLHDVEFDAPIDQVFVQP